ncbi:MAG: ribonuclease Z [Candidatus Reconcilbacillus cellulovorans]|uniref:Ribonuclease Z n=1 Tax=Candidatus Reconcilbacillus cellulovorans TaxID=1906605 RepID=A0A2A6E476_9BACL|nr:MAG: ribonuclease Z [Candidatus Reconcilbacillus cellulovorans]
MKLLFLGTGAGMPSRQRNVSAIALRLHEERGTFWLFDCGEGTQHQMLRSPLKLSKLEKLLITHLHGDHLYGLPGLLTTRSNQGGESPLDIYGPPGIRAFVDTVLKISDARVNFPIRIREVETGEIFRDEQFAVFAGKLDHRVACFGYRVVEADRPGTLNHEKLRSLGIPPGPIYGRIKNGEDVRLPDGTVLRSADFVGPPERGRIVAILGDTRPCRAAVELARNADVVVHEATFDDSLSGQARQFFHSTAGQAAELARRAGAKRLVLTHISSRYQEGGVHVLLDQARRVFPETEVADDFREIDIPRKKVGLSTTSGDIRQC